MANEPNTIDWEQLLLVYLHDPVDKALDIHDHETRAGKYAKCALNRAVDKDEIKITEALADQLAAMVERIPMPTAGDAGERAVGLEDGRLEIRHPVSGEPEVLEGLEIDENAVLETISGIVDGLTEPRQRFLALWRLLPERLEKRLGHAFVRLPADTRVPDHSVFHHADIASGIFASRAGTHGGAYLSLSLGPVQSFIEAARTVRDLWSGSAILSWLTFQGLTPVLERFGPTALVFPALRGNPLMDLWLRNQVGLDHCIAEPSVRERRSPSIPNRFVALVPWGQDGCDGHAMAELCAEAVRDAWGRIAEDVHDALHPKLVAIDPEWAKRWHRQVDQFFEVRTSVLPEQPLDDIFLAGLIGGARTFESLWPEAAAVRRLARVIPGSHRPSYGQESAGRWQAHLETSARLMEAQRTVKHVPASLEEMPSPAKCSLLGTFEQMGPTGLEEGRRFWLQAREISKIHGVRLRSGERFSALALCKRFAAPTTLHNEFELEMSDLRFPDTATVAAADWLRDNGMEYGKWHNWNGRWLHQVSRFSEEEDDRPPQDIWDQISAARERSLPPSYYAILMMDADDMGLWLKGEKAPKLRDVLHPAMRRYYENLGEDARDCLEVRRPVGPALHSSISEALNNFASHIAPSVVNRYSGTLIYSGGDDVLALLPASRAVQCAHELEQRFRGIEPDTPATQMVCRDGPLLTMGMKATMSAGIAFVHVKEDLRIALQAARHGEATAKASGRNVAALRFMRRSGEHAEALLGWEQAPWFQELVRLFADGATDRWAYRLRAELPTLAGPYIPEAAVAAEIRRLVDRSSEGAEGSAVKLCGETAATWWRQFSEAERNRDNSMRELLTTFVTICQGAAFVARSDDG